MTLPVDRDFDPHNLPDELLSAIGFAIASASQTENMLEWAIGGCLGVDAEYAMAVTTHMTLPLKFSVLRSVAEIRIDNLDDLDELDQILDRIDQTLGKRHRIAHDGWCRDPETEALFRAQQVARTRLEAEWVPTTAKAVRADGEAIYQAGMALMTFILKRNLVSSMPPQPRPRWHKSKAARKKRRKL